MIGQYVLISSSSTKKLPPSIIYNMNHSNGNSIVNAAHHNGHHHDQMVKSSSDTFVVENTPQKKVLVLYTGGTIGMFRNQCGALIPKANCFVNNLKEYPNMHDSAYAKKHLSNKENSLVLPLSEIDTRRIIYDVIEYSPLCDSSNMTIDHWIQIAMDIKESYEDYDGFVILHGTDTLSYTASALSFMLEALGKTVIITGSQISIFQQRSDGVDNFLSSLVIAADYSIPEVVVVFNNQLLRGNRTSKMSSEDFNAFNSANFPPLAKMGTTIDVNYQSIFRSCVMNKFQLHTKLDRNIGLLRLFPGITRDLVKSFLRPPIKGMVLQSYGAGNVPSNRDNIITELQEATERGVIIVNITQCAKGTVSTLYETGHVLINAGVTPGYDMTPEAALTKLAYVLSKDEWDIKTKRVMMQTNLRGELTTIHPPPVQNWEFLEAVAKTMHVNAPDEIRYLGSIIFPAMLCSAVIARDIVQIETLHRNGADISLKNADGRTALHVACCEGNLMVVEHLLKMGANVHLQDRYGRSPLTDAVDHDRHDIIKLLRKCGAHLHERGQVIGERLVIAASTGNTNRLRSYLLSGANLSQGDASGRTALHIAALFNFVSTAKFLLENGADPSCKDVLCQTPYDLSVLANATDTAILLGNYEKQ